MLLKRQAPTMSCTSRGKIAVKVSCPSFPCAKLIITRTASYQLRQILQGKGDMVTYWVGDDLISKNKKTRRKTLRFQRLGTIDSIGASEDGTTRVSNQRSSDSGDTTSPGEKTLQFRVGGNESVLSEDLLADIAATVDESDVSLRDESNFSFAYVDENPHTTRKEGTADGDGNESSGTGDGSRATAVTTESDGSPETFSDEPVLHLQGSKDIDGTGGFVPPLGRFEPGITEC